MLDQIVRCILKLFIVNYFCLFHWLILMSQMSELPASQLKYRKDIEKTSKAPPYNVECSYRLNNKTLGSCKCNTPNELVKNTVCNCSHTLQKKLVSANYICNCDKKYNETYSVNCRCFNENDKLIDLNCTSKVKNGKHENIIKLGVIIPYTLGAAKITAYYSGRYYASAMYIAIDDINNNTNLLPNHKLTLVWANSECDWKRTLNYQYQMMQDEKVDAFIGCGCGDCKTAARNAAAFNLPMISHVSHFCYYYHGKKCGF